MNARDASRRPPNNSRSDADDPLLRGQQGASAVEYAVILCVLVAGALVALDSVGLLVEPAADQVSAALAGHVGPSAGDLGQQASTTGQSSNNGNPSIGAPAWRIPMGLLAIGACATTLVLLRRRRRYLLPPPEEKPAQDTQPPPAYALKRQQILKFIAHDTGRQIGSRVAVRHVMTQSLATVPPQMSPSKLRALMQERRIRHLLVVGGNGRLQGVISDRDVLFRQGRKASDIMTRNAVTAAPEALLGDVVRQMLAGRFSCVPVVDQGRLCGVLTTTDLLLAFQCISHLIQQVTEDVCAGATAVLPRCDVSASPDSAPRQEPALQPAFPRGGGAAQA
jgi:CBS domain-containing protein/Flp pilus assembly pilin Flp